MPDVDIGPVTDLPTDRCVAVADGRAVVVRTADDEVAAFHPNCLHKASELAGGLVVDDGKLQCPMHFWRFHVPSGVHTGGRGVLTAYPVSVSPDGRATVSIPEDGPAVSIREQLLARAKQWDREAPPATPTSKGRPCVEDRRPR